MEEINKNPVKATAAPVTDYAPEEQDRGQPVRRTIKLECKGHPAGTVGAGGETIFCDGSCRGTIQPEAPRCELNLVSLRSCRRAQATIRITSSGMSVRLCKKCDAAHGDTVGLPGENRACVLCGDSFQVAVGSEVTICQPCNNKNLAEARAAEDSLRGM